MKLSGRTDISAPMAFVFDALSDFESWERAALRRGADVMRTDTLRGTCVGMSWLVRFAWRGREREIQIKLAELDTPTKMTFAGDGPSIEGGANIEVIELASRRTRMFLQLELKPRTLAARLFVQSLKLAKSRVNGQFEIRLQQIAKDIEARYAATGPN
jgi:carbon monoxide dehydrogenase subunit G